jgi:hypothetical protein
MNQAPEGSENVPHRFFNRNAYLKMGGQNIEHRTPNGMSAKAGE